MEADGDPVTQAVLSTSQPRLPVSILGPCASTRLDVSTKTDSHLPAGANYQNYLIGVQSVVIDAKDRLWILDTGRVFAPDGKTLLQSSVSEERAVCGKVRRLADKEAGGRAETHRSGSDDRSHFPDNCIPNGQS